MCPTGLNNKKWLKCNIFRLNELFFAVEKRKLSRLSVNTKKVKNKNNFKVA